MTRLLLSTFLLVMMNVTWSHAVHDARIETLNRQIAANPADSDAIMHRAELYREHKLWARAQGDYARARALLTSPELVDLLEGRMHTEARDPAHALPLLARYTTAVPADPRGWVWRARAHRAAGSDALAAQAFRQAVATTPKPGPDLYLEYVAALHVSAGASVALAALEQAVAELGPLVTLIEPAIGMTRDESPDLALSWLDKLPARLKMTPRWLALRGDLTRQAEQPRAAHTLYAEALKRLRAYPAARRSTQASIQLEQYLLSAVAATAAPDAATGTVAAN